MTFSTSDILSLSAFVAALLALFGYYNRVFTWIRKQDRLEQDIRAMKQEQRLLCVALCACLDGLEQLGANHSVPAARRQLNDYIQQQAHK